MLKLIERLGRAYFSFTAYVVVVIGISLIASSLVYAVSLGWSHWNSIDVTAEVVRIDEKIGENNILYSPVFVAISPSGSQVEYSESAWFWPTPHEVGDRVLARYNVKTGAIVSEKTEFLNAATCFQLFVFGVLLCGLGFLFRKWARSSSHN